MNSRIPCGRRSCRHGGVDNNRSISPANRRPRFGVAWQPSTNQSVAFSGMSQSVPGPAIPPSAATVGDVGRRVVVGGEKTGWLRYVGPLLGKDGTFAGIELDLPEGKNDGSFEGFHYFHSAAKHGIFAPLAKVVALGPEGRPLPPPPVSGAPLLATSLSVLPAPPSFSAMTDPCLSVDSGGRSSTDSPLLLTAQSSVASSASQQQQQSDLISSLAGAEDIFDVAPPTDFFRTSLSSVSNVDDLEHEDISPRRKESTPTKEAKEERLVMSRTIDLTESALFPPTLIQSDDGALTPTAEPICLIHVAFGAAAAAIDSTDQQVELEAEQPEIRASSALSGDTGYHGDTDGSVPRSSLSPAEQSEKREEKASTSGRKLRRETVTLVQSPLNEIVVISRGASPKQKKKQLTSALKSPAAVAASRPPKPPKPLSKNQLIMEQLQKSREADRNRPKKPVESKLKVLLNLTAPQPAPATANDGETTEMAANGGDEEGLSKMPQPSSAVVARRGVLSAAKSATVAPVNTRPPLKPRQSLLPPKAPPKGKPTETALAAAAEAVKRRPVAPSSHNHTAPSGIPRSRSGSQTSTTGAPPVILSTRRGVTAAPPASAATNVTQRRPKAVQNGKPANAQKTAATVSPRKTADNAQRESTDKPFAEGQRKLWQNSRAFDVLAVVLNNRVADLSNTNQKLLAERLQSLSQSQEAKDRIDSLQSAVERLHAEKTALDSAHTIAIDELTANHRSALKLCQDEFNVISEARLKEQQKRLLQEKSDALRDTDEKYEVNLFQLHEAHKEQLQALNEKHANEMTAFSAKVSELESQVLRAAAEKDNLRHQLSLDADARVQRLSAEVLSLNEVQKLKADETHRLRQEAAQLAERAAMVPRLRDELKRANHRCEELRAAVDQRRDNEKLLAAKCDELSRSAQKEAHRSEEAQHLREEAEYRLSMTLSGLADGDGGEEASRFYSPLIGSSRDLHHPPLHQQQGQSSAVQRRSRSSHSESHHDPSPLSGGVVFRHSYNVANSPTNGQAHQAASFHSASATMPRTAAAMSRSTVGCFQESGRRRLSTAAGDSPDVIYTPDRVFTGKLEYEDAPGEEGEAETTVAGRRAAMAPTASFDDLTDSPDLSDSQQSSCAAPPAPATNGYGSRVVDSGIFTSIHSESASTSTKDRL